MERRVGSAFSRLVALLAIFLFTMSATADFTVSYCSNQNTGSTDDFFWTWQSNGKCTDHCNGLGTYAFAVIQYTDCWCTDYIPAQQVDTSGCMVDCPGFPSEKCGDKDKDLFIYIELAGSPSGTQSSSQPTSTDVSSSAPPASTEAPSSTTTTSAPASSSQVDTSVATSSAQPAIQTVTEESSTTVYPSSTSTSASSATPVFRPFSSTFETEPTTTSKTHPTSTDEEPTTSVWVVTESGAIVTRTVVISPTSAAAKTGGNGSGTNTGAIVGGVVGGVLGLLAVAGVVLFTLWRRRKQRREQEQGQAESPSGITRNTSTMSKAGLLGNTAERDVQYPPRIMTNFSTRGSRHDGDSISPNTADSRFSQPVMIDSRLDPRAVLTFHGANVSRESLASIDDSRDYGRQLNVRNPDPEHRD